MCLKKDLPNKKKRKTNPTKKQIREENLAAALRRNLKIRKSEK